MSTGRFIREAVRSGQFRPQYLGRMTTAQIAALVPANYRTGTTVTCTDGVNAEREYKLQAGAFGVDGDGKTATIDVILTQFNVDSSGDATGALRRAAAYILARGVGTIHIPDDREYTISDNVELGIGINLMGPGRIRRTHPLSVNNYSFTLLGNNKIAGHLKYSGGWQTIEDPGLNLSIKDFWCVGGGCCFEYVKFDNSCGTFIQFSADQYEVAQTLEALDVSNCEFGDYADHCLYSQGYNLVKTGGITFSNNRLKTTSITTRQAVKLKNIDVAHVAFNKFDLPNAVFSTVEVGLDGGLAARACNNVSIIGNTGKCFRFVESVAVNNEANRDFFINKLSVALNIVTCSHFGIALGLRPDATNAYSTRVKGASISYNQIDCLTHVINGEVNGSNNGIESVFWNGNTSTITGGLTAFETYGNIKLLSVNGGSFEHTGAFDQANAIFNRNAICDTNGGALMPTIQGQIDISDINMMGNFACYFSEQPSSTRTSINFKSELINNRHFGTQALKRIAVLTSVALASATGQIRATNNRCIGGAASASACSNKALLVETDASKRYVDPASTSDKQFGHYAVYTCSADLGFNPLTLGAGVYYQVYRKGDGSYVRIT